MPDDGGHASVGVLLVQGVIVKVEPQEVGILVANIIKLFSPSLVH
jgi:hypothetical protein